MFDSLVAATAGAHGAGAVAAWGRLESAASARRLAAMVCVLDAAHAVEGSAEREHWSLDTWEAVSAQIAATLGLTGGAAANLLLTAVALRDRFPKLAAVFADGLVTFAVVRAIVWRSRLVTDPDALARLDEALAGEVARWGPMSVHTTETTIDEFITRVDPDAVRRTQTRARGRSVEISIEDGSGMAELFATVFATDAEAFDRRVDALAGTVCEADPRTRDQRRSDAIGAMARSADRLACLCGREDCTAAQNPPAAGVVVYVIAHQDALDVPAMSDEPPPDDPGPDDVDAGDNGGDGGGEDVESPDPGPDATSPSPAEECSGLDGLAPAVFIRPTTGILTDGLIPRPGHLSTIRPAVTTRGRFLPGPVFRRAALNATIRRILHPGQAPPEPRYRPSKRLADFVRCRDLTCRFPGCREPATNCDVDHTIPWPHGPTQAANLKILCRRHHLLKTFWPGWRDRQHPDGTIEWTDPEGRTHVTAPGSRLLFPELCRPTAPVTTATNPPVNLAPGLTMPRRKTTRKQDRARRIAYERELNRAELANAESEDVPPD
ncbi:HNH endonuclease signature motif containing protein [Mycobacterium antarcticum]|uniref:HNH endonuclease signature motif containing protein n=1 Tax=unclassified Mycolicibacterium TaxID=2636767 RepID=UPI0024E0636A|nr:MULTISPECIES: HNH endonuclease signature motif containing protein [unclassified Mycolicibacterium]